MKNFYYGPTQDYDLVGKYLHWQQVISREDIEVNDDNFDEIYGLSVSEIAKKLHLNKSKVQPYLEEKYPNSRDVLYAIMDPQDNEHRYYKPEILEEVENHFTYKGTKAQTALERLKATKNSYSHQVKEKISTIPKMVKKPIPSEEEFERKFLAAMGGSQEESSSSAIKEPIASKQEKQAALEIESKQSDLPKDEIEKETTTPNFKVQLVCETGTYTSTQFESFAQAISFFQKTTEPNKLNQFLLVTDQEEQESLISVKQILEIKPFKE